MQRYGKPIGLIAVVAVCIALVVCMIQLLCPPSRNAADLSDYIQKHEHTLVELAMDYPDQYKRLNGYLGIEAIDTREDACAAFSFPWSNDIPEGGSFLYYTENGILENSGYSISDTTRISGLGINGQGYIHCTLLKQNWFFVEYWIPT